MNRDPHPGQDHGARDIAGNRAARKWSAAEMAGRLAWETVGAAIFRMVPRPFWGVRRAILRMFGARIGNGVHIHRTARIAVPWNLEMGDYASLGDRAIVYNLGKINIGARATVSQNAHLCAGTHDHASPTFDLLKPPITVGPEAWICADAFIGPGVTVGAGAIVAARAVAVRDVPDGARVAGNPARSIARETPGG